MIANELNVYLLVFDASRLSNSTMTRFLDRIDEVENWISFLPGTVALISSLGLSRIRDRLLPGLKGEMFLLTSVKPGSKDGWLPETVWEFLNTPQPAAARVA